MTSPLMTPLVTIGYEGLSLRDFVGFLRASGATRLLDVRAIPQSRKPGFSKRMLAASVADVGIAYTHLRALGTPKPGRIAARNGDEAGLARIYEAHLATPDACAALAEAVALAAAEPCCLLCFEADPALCHRTIVAARLAGTGTFAVRHLRCI